jgi:hypothetical protein
MSQFKDRLQKLSFKRETRKYLELQRRGDKEYIRAEIRARILKYLMDGDSLTASTMFNKMRGFVNKYVGTYKDLYEVLDALCAERKIFKLVEGPKILYSRYPLDITSKTFEKLTKEREQKLKSLVDGLRVTLSWRKIVLPDSQLFRLAEHSLDNLKDFSFEDELQTLLKENWTDLSKKSEGQVGSTETTLVEQHSANVVQQQIDSTASVVQQQVEDEFKDWK